MAFTFSIKDTYRQAVEAASGGKQTVLYDDKGYPSIMNIIPKLSYKDVGLSDSTKALPAFMVDDAEKPEIFVPLFLSRKDASLSLPRVKLNSGQKRRRLL